MVTNTELISFLNGKTIAVVGNSEQVTDYNYGEEIDDFDIVFRMNKFNVKNPYVDHTGTKTDILVTNFWNKITPDVSIMNELGIKYIFSTLPDKVCKYFPNQKEFDRNLGQAEKSGWVDYLNKMFMIESEFLDEVGDICNFNRPSSGILTISWLLKNVDFSFLFCIGLSFGENRWHYNQSDYGDVGPMKKRHDPYSERYVLNKFMKENPGKSLMLDPLMKKIIEGIR